MNPIVALFDQNPFDAFWAGVKHLLEAVTHSSLGSVQFFFASLLTLAALYFLGGLLLEKVFKAKGDRVLALVTALIGFAAFVLIYALAYALIAPNVGGNLKEILPALVGAGGLAAAVYVARQKLKLELVAAILFVLIETFAGAGVLQVSGRIFKAVHDALS